MDRFSAIDNSDGRTGYLVVRVSTALGAIPLKGATVTVRGNTKESSGVVFSLVSDRDGLTQKVALPTPPRNASSSPSSSPPYSSWNVDVFLEGYSSALYTGVPVYASVVSVQPAILVPLGERFPARNIYNESSAPSL